MVKSLLLGCAGSLPSYAHILSGLREDFLRGVDKLTSRNNNKGKRIVITDANGFIGVNLVVARENHWDHYLGWRFGLSGGDPSKGSRTYERGKKYLHQPHSSLICSFAWTLTKPVSKTVDKLVIGPPSHLLPGVESFPTRSFRI